MVFLTREEIKESLNSINQDEDFDNWFKIVEPILTSHEFQVRRLFKHHENSVWDHSILVSFRAYKITKRRNLNSRETAIGGLLHDFYPYAWKYSIKLHEYDDKYLMCIGKKYPLLKKHGFTHAREACYNYQKYYGEYESDLINDIITKHMFPLNIKLPKYKESWIVSYSDKVESIKDLFKGGIKMYK